MNQFLSVGRDNRGGLVFAEPVCLLLKLYRRSKVFIVLPSISMKTQYSMFDWPRCRAVYTGLPIGWCRW